MDRNRLLLIDDDPVIRAIYRDHFQAAGFDIREADNGDEGLRLYDEFRPDAVLLDLKMPGMDGVTWLRLLRRSRRRSVPVVVLTSAEANARDEAADESDTVFVMRKDSAQPRVVVEAVMTAVDTAA